MEEILQQFVVMIESFVEGNNIFISVFFGCFAVILESILPMLPLAVFIAINMIAFGNILGFIISWLSTIVGCSISFFLCRKCRYFIQRKLKRQYKILEFINRIDTIKFSSLVLILAIPFTPAFSINIAAGLSEMKYEKYFMALLISKISIVYFWGYVGTTIVESVTDIRVMLKLFFMIVFIFICSKFITKKFDL